MNCRETEDWKESIDLASVDLGWGFLGECKLSELRATCVIRLARYCDLRLDAFGVSVTLKADLSILIILSIKP